MAADGSSMPTADPESDPERDVRADAEPAGPRRRRRRRWPWFIGVLAVLGVWAALGAWMLADAKRHAERGIDELRSAQDDLTAADLLRGEGRDRFVAAQRQFRKAHDRASNPVLTAARWVPFVGRQVRAVERMTGAADETLEIGIGALDASSAAIDAVEPVGPGRIELAERLGEIAAAAAADLDAIDLGPEQHLFGSLQQARDRFGAEFDDLAEAVDDLAAAGDGLGEFLRGPSRYLVLAANNSEMRMGSGAFLSAGVLSVENGSFELGPMEATEDLLVPAGAVPIDDEDFAQRWSFAEPTEDFRELATSTRFDVVGDLALSMWEQVKGERLDGVLVIDPIALRSLLELTGPVVVEGKEYSKDNVVPEIFLEQYRVLEDQGAPAQIARRDRLSKIARAAIDALEAGGWDTVDLVDALRPAVGGRHVLAYSGREVQQRGWAGAGVAGVTEPDSLTLGLQNRAGNKLDQFIVAEARLERADKEGPNQEITVDLLLNNLAPADLPRYVEGPYPTTPRAAAGKYQGWVTVELPAFAQDNYLEVGGERVGHVATGRDGDHRVVAALVEFERGTSVTVTVHFEVADHDETLYVNPGARVPPIQWHAGDKLFDDASGHRIDLADL